MRYLFSALLMVLQASVACAIPVDDLENRVTVIEKTRWVQTRSEHKHYCGSNPNVEACTHFIPRWQAFVCKTNERQWSIEGSAQLLAIVILRRPGTIFDKREILKHEREHITDVRGFLDQYLVDLEQQRFPAEADCQSAAQGEERAFPDRLRQSIRASKARRD